jgi:glycosyltransferase involved in cell wall biosynthesis
MPLVSVVVPTHNRPEMLAEALASVRAQTFADCEIIVVSNGESAEMRDASCKVTIAHRGRHFTLDEGNLPAARNFAIARAAGEWIAFLDDDDVWLPRKLERQLGAARATGADMIACDCICFFPDSRETVSGARVRAGWPYTKAVNHQRWGAPPSAVIVRKAAIDAVGGFDPEQRYCEDIDLWRRIAWRHSIHQMEEALVRYRRHAESMSRRSPMISRYDLRNFRKMLRDTPPDLRWALPSLSTLARRWLLRTIMPGWMRQPKKSWLVLVRGCGLPWRRLQRTSGDDGDGIGEGVTPGLDWAAQMRGRRFERVD